VDLDNRGRTVAVPTTNIKSGNVVHDERSVGELRERIKPRRRNYVSADTTGSFTGTPEEALDCACGLYLDTPDF
jgi:hypothetical protein